MHKLKKKIGNKIKNKINFNRHFCKCSFAHKFILEIMYGNTLIIVVIVATKYTAIIKYVIIDINNLCKIGGIMFVAKNFSNIPIKFYIWGKKEMC